MLIVFSLTWYAVWGRRRVEVEHAGASFRAKWAEFRWQMFMQPTVHYAAATEEGPSVRPTVEAHGPRQVMVALANPAHGADLLRLGRYVASGADEGGHVLGLHLTRVPLQTPLAVARDEFARDQPAIERTMSSADSFRRRADAGPTCC